jgi:tripartite-type tricarboxylate transporter receptor subunit TctC
MIIGAVQAQTPEEFYEGKTLTLVISAAPGGASDFFARAFADYFSKHIPGQPQVVVTNQPGGGGIVAASQLQRSQPRDGTVIALLQKNNLYRPLVEGMEDQADPREVSWIGSLNKDVYYIFAWEGTPVQTADEMFTKTMSLGATGFANENRTLPAMMNEYMGTKFDIIPGYQGSDEVGLAMERGEVDGKVGTLGNLMSGSEAAYLHDDKIKILVQLGLTTHPAFPDVPNLTTYIKDPDVLALAKFMIQPFDVGRPLAAPKGLPEDRLATLRAAFDATTADPEFIAHMKKLNSDIDPVSGVEIERIIGDIYATPEPILAKARKLLTPQ